MTTLLKHTGIPNFTVYLYPGCEKQWNELIVKLIHYGANPMSSQDAPPQRNEINLMRGLVYLLDEKELITCAEYVGGRILCLQRYQNGITDFELNVNQRHSFWLYEIHNKVACYRLGQKEFFKKQLLQSFEKTKVNVLFPPTGPQKTEEPPMLLD